MSRRTKRPTVSTGPAGRAAKPLRRMIRQTARGFERVDNTDSPVRGIKPAKGQSETPGAPSGAARRKRYRHTRDDRLAFIVGQVHGTETKASFDAERGPTRPRDLAQRVAERRPQKVAGA